MIVKKSWESKKVDEWTDIFKIRHTSPVYTYTGWFLFGIIPIYIIRN